MGALSERVVLPIGAPRHCSSLRGFTLAELLVVVLIVGVGAALAYPRLVPSPSRALERDASMLALALDHALQLAQWRRETLGLSVDASGYRFWHRDEQQGRWIAGVDDSLPPRQFETARGVAQFAQAGIPVPPGTVVALNASGRNDPIVIALSNGHDVARIRSDPLNRVSTTMGGP